MRMFKRDLDDGIQRLKLLDLKAEETYVYPYVYSFATTGIALKQAGFTKIVGSGNLFRVSIEDLAGSKINDYWS